jgi:hypothetical protein
MWNVCLYTNRLSVAKDPFSAFIVVGGTPALLYERYCVINHPRKTTTTPASTMVANKANVPADDSKYRFSRCRIFTRNPIGTSPGRALPWYNFLLP